MTVLELRFPAGRYHATPWGRHVNEGAVEWPPSPWRIVRALIATWYLKARRDEEISESTIRALADALSQPPVFHLPRATTAHTRHYMPYNEGKNEKTTKIFDTFIQVAENDAVIVVWNVDLPPEQFAALKKLAERLGYFGRAESLVEAGVRNDLPEKIERTHSVSEPLADGAKLPEKTELVRLLAPMSPDAYLKWREEFLKTCEQPSAGSKKKTGKKAKTDDLPEESIVPADLFKALHADTGELQAAGWNLPPGAEFVNYTRRENAFTPATKPRPRRCKELPTVARFALASTVPPGMVKALAVGEQIHTVLCKESDGHPIFTGAGLQGHQHAHVFCESVNNPLGHITHVTVFAAGGFNTDAVKALRNILWTWGFKRHELRLVLQGVGQPSDFTDCKLFGRSDKWQSVTPFVSTRHAKTFRDGRPKMDANGWQTGSAAHDLLRLLALEPNWHGAKISKQLDERNRPFVFGENGERKFRSLQFQTLRHGGGGSRGHDGGTGFSIEFSKPVCGPIAVGYGSHFGLGLFQPIMNSGAAQLNEGDSDESVRNQSKL
jgi:CRISPR-associated protein Csb2